MPNQHTDGPRRRVRMVVMLTTDEHKLAMKLAGVYDATVSDVLRSGIGALGREHSRAQAARAGESLEVVHVLHHGLPLCRFSVAMPSGWPIGHRWVRKGEPGATCEGCKTAIVRAAIGE